MSTDSCLFICYRFFFVRNNLICIKDLKVNVVCPKSLLCAMQMQFSWSAWFRYRVNDHNIVCVYGSQRTVPQCDENNS